jgi:hypothetical protein
VKHVVQPDPKAAAKVVRRMLGDQSITIMTTARPTGGGAGTGNLRVHMVQDP